MRANQTPGSENFSIVILNSSPSKFNEWNLTEKLLFNVRITQSILSSLSGFSGETNWENQVQDLDQGPKAARPGTTRRKRTSKNNV